MWLALRSAFRGLIRSEAAAHTAGSNLMMTLYGSNSSSGQCGASSYLDLIPFKSSMPAVDYPVGLAPVPARTAARVDPMIANWRDGKPIRVSRRLRHTTHG